MIGRLRFRLSKHFGAKNVLDDFTLEVRGGEFVTFLGPSGCGKSTALNLLAGLLQPTAGEIWLDDERLDTWPPERRGFGMAIVLLVLVAALYFVRPTQMVFRLGGK